MPRSSKPPKSEGTGKVVPIKAGKSNGYDPDTVKGFIAEIEDQQREIDEIMDKAAEAAAPYRDEIAKIRKRAAEAGLPKKEFAAVCKRKRLLEKARDAAKKLDEEQQQAFDGMCHAAGLSWDDTPLAKSVASS